MFWNLLFGDFINYYVFSSCNNSFILRTPFLFGDRYSGYAPTDFRDLALYGAPIFCEMGDSKSLTLLFLISLASRSYTLSSFICGEVKITFGVYEILENYYFLYSKSLVKISLGRLREVLPASSPCALTCTFFGPSIGLSLTTPDFFLYVLLTTLSLFSSRVFVSFFV